MINAQLQMELAKSLFNKTWEYLDKKELTEEEKAEMVNIAHASLYHWKQVGTPENRLIGEWLLARVYSVLKIGDLALYHSKRSLNLCQREGISGFNLAYAYEAMSMSYFLLNNKTEACSFYNLAEKEIENVNDKAERDLIDSDLIKLKQLLKIF